jgi:hypothetical protein
MGFKTKFSISFLFGLTLGLFLIFQVFHFKNSAKSSKQTVNTIYEEKLAKKLYDEVKVLCWIFTNSKSHRIKWKLMSRTWGSRCNKFLFFSQKSDPVNGTITLPVDDDEDQWKITQEIYKYAS